MTCWPCSVRSSVTTPIAAARGGRLTFEDLLIEARNLLVNSAGARRFFRERYSHILIDEFQDTDPLQAEIVLLLAAEHDTNDWTNATPAPGRLLVVGDPQQAIYRFRRADIDTYTKGPQTSSSRPPKRMPRARRRPASASTSAPDRS